MSRKPYWELSRQGKYHRLKTVGTELFKLAENDVNHSPTSLDYCQQPTNNSPRSSFDYVGDDNQEAAISNPLEEDDILSDPSSVSNHCSTDQNFSSFSHPSTSGTTFEFNDDILSDDSLNRDWCSKINESESLKEKLKHWAIKFNISHVAFTALLTILQLHSCFSNLPVDARTVLSTPRQVSLFSVKPGHYAHIGLEVGLKKFGV